MKIRVPDHFTLMGREWTVERPESITIGNTPCHGSCRARDKRIEVERSLTGLTALEIFAHEIAHAGLSQLDLPERTEELVCHAMEYVILDAIQAMVEEG